MIYTRRIRHLVWEVIDESHRQHGFILELPDGFDLLLKRNSEQLKFQSFREAEKYAKEQLFEGLR